MRSKSRGARARRRRRGASCASSFAPPRRHVSSFEPGVNAAGVNGHAHPAQPSLKQAHIKSFIGNKAHTNFGDSIAVLLRLGRRGPLRFMLVRKRVAGSCYGNEACFDAFPGDCFRGDCFRGNFEPDPCFDGCFGAIRLAATTPFTAEAVGSGATTSESAWDEGGRWASEARRTLSVLPCFASSTRRVGECTAMLIVCHDDSCRFGPSFGPPILARP